MKLGWFLGDKRQAVNAHRWAAMSAWQAEPLPFYCLLLFQKVPNFF